MSKVEYNFGGSVLHTCTMPHILCPTYVCVLCPTYYTPHSFWWAKIWRTIIILLNFTHSNIFCYTVHACGYSPSLSNTDTSVLHTSKEIVQWRKPNSFTCSEVQRRWDWKRRGREWSMEDQQNKVHRSTHIQEQQMGILHIDLYKNNSSWVYVSIHVVLLNLHVFTNTVQVVHLHSAIYHTLYLHIL